ncbi:MAG: response regulator transcription factor [Saprospiraceae bacterium]|nr:response regulator transcription factor [Saprospiraceae bacterium]
MTEPEGPIKILIIEDELPARTHLLHLLNKLDVPFTVADRLDSVKQSVAWLTKYQADLIFMDVHLSDGNSLEIIKQIKFDSPVIFVTAYDEFAIQAFKSNGIDYLLKPIDEDELREAMAKFERMHKGQQQWSIDKILGAVQQKPVVYQERFLVHRGEKMMSLPTDQIAYFEGEDRYVYLTKHDGSRFIIDYRLSDLEKILDPLQFFRVNRSFITHFKAIDSMLNLSKSRIKLELKPGAKREVIVSSEQSLLFKQWLNQ